MQFITLSQETNMLITFHHLHALYGIFSVAYIGDVYSYMSHTQAIYKTLAGDQEHSKHTSDSTFHVIGI